MTIQFLPETILLTLKNLLRQIKVCVAVPRGGCIGYISHSKRKAAQTQAMVVRVRACVLVMAGNCAAYGVCFAPDCAEIIQSVLRSKIRYFSTNMQEISELSKRPREKISAYPTLNFAPDMR